MRDLARVAQLVDEALHHLFVLRHVRVQELQDQAFLDHGVFHEQHSAERAFADLLDVLVTTFDDLAGFERGDVELLGRGGGFLRFLDDLIDIAEAAGSCPVYPLLKRPDERHVTMRAYDHPVFVEDMARATAEALARHEQIGSFSVEAASEESIHNHSAFARVMSRPRGDGHAWTGAQ